jgi:hypothetical protein
LYPTYSREANDEYMCFQKFCLIHHTIRVESKGLD